MALFLGLLGGLSSQHNNTWPWEKGLLRSLEGEWTCAAAGQTEWPHVLQWLQTMFCQPGLYTCTQTHTRTHTYVPTHRETPVDGPRPSTSPSHWVIFTQALSPLIGADEGLIGSFFYNTQYLSNGKLREAAWVELMRGFAQIKDLVWACFTEWEKRKVEDIFCVLHIFHLCAGIWKEEGVAKGTQWLLKRWALVRIKGSVLYCLGAHSLVCLLIMRKGCSSNECGKVLSGQ